MKNTAPPARRDHGYCNRVHKFLLILPSELLYDAAIKERNNGQSAPENKSAGLCEEKEDLRQLSAATSQPGIDLQECRKDKLHRIAGLTFQTKRSLH